MGRNDSETTNVLALWEKEALRMKAQISSSEYTPSIAAAGGSLATLIAGGLYLRFLRRYPTPFAVPENLIKKKGWIRGYVTRSARQ
jgi:hypothetical protein